MISLLSASCLPLRAVKNFAVDILACTPVGELLDRCRFTVGIRRDLRLGRWNFRRFASRPDLKLDSLRFQLQRCNTFSQLGDLLRCVALDVCAGSSERCLGFTKISVDLLLLFEKESVNLRWSQRAVVS